MADDRTPDPPDVRRIVAALVAIGLLGIAVELVLIDHIESASQLAPVVVLPIAAILLVPGAFGIGRGGTLALRAVLWAVVASGLAGVGLHFYESWEFQREIDPSLGGAARAMAALRAQSPPSLAPGQIALLGLLGLATSGPAPAASPSVNKES